jgi:hypothetical protein
MIAVCAEEEARSRRGLGRTRRCAIPSCLSQLKGGHGADRLGASATPTEHSARVVFSTNC